MKCLGTGLVDYQQQRAESRAVAGNTWGTGAVDYQQQVGIHTAVAVNSWGAGLVVLKRHGSGFVEDGMSWDYSWDRWEKRILSDEMDLLDKLH